MAVVVRSQLDNVSAASLGRAVQTLYTLLALFVTGIQINQGRPHFLGGLLAQCKSRGS